MIPRNIIVAAVALIVTVLVTFVPALEQYSGALNEILVIVIVYILGSAIVESGRIFAGAPLPGGRLAIPDEIITAAVGFVVVLLVTLVPPLAPLSDTLMEIILLIVSLILGQQVMKAARHYSIGIQNIMRR